MSCIYIYIINIHNTHTYITQTKTFILDAINHLTALFYRHWNSKNAKFKMLFSPGFCLKWMWTWFRGESLIGEVWCRLTLYAAGLAYAHVQTVLGPVHTLQLLKVSPGVPDVDEGGSRRWKRVRGFSFSHMLLECRWRKQTLEVFWSVLEG